MPTAVPVAHPTEFAERTAQRALHAITHVRAPFSLRLEHSRVHEVQPGVWGFDVRLLSEAGTVEIEVRLHEDLEAGHRVELLSELRACSQRMLVTADDLGVLATLRDLTLHACLVCKVVTRVAVIPDVWTWDEALRRRTVTVPPVQAPQPESTTIAEERGELPLRGVSRVA